MQRTYLLTVARIHDENKKSVLLATRWRAPAPGDFPSLCAQLLWCELYAMKDEK